MSRTPIREALGRLRDDRLVEVLPQRGDVRLADQSPGRPDVQFIREALETAAIRRVGERYTGQALSPNGGSVI